MPNARRKYSSQNWNRAEENRRSQSSQGRQVQEQDQNQNSPRRQQGSNIANLGENILPFASSYFAPFINFMSEMDRALNKSFRSFGLPAIPDMFEGQGVFSPNVDIISNENEYVITAEVPGIEERDLNIEVTNDGTLCISGIKRQESQERRGNLECVECSYGAFERNLSLPEDASRDQIEANFRNGVLTIICPREESRRQQPRQIEINSNGGGSAERGERSSAVQERSGGASQERNLADRERGQQEKGAQGSKRAA